MDPILTVEKARNNQKRSTLLQNSRIGTSASYTNQHKGNFCCIVLAWFELVFVLYKNRHEQSEMECKSMVASSKSHSCKKHLTQFCIVYSWDALKVSMRNNDVEKEIGRKARATN
mmetsp:Transcript_25507/g.43540  ORF Transcript_25507/g.43540 Transcript_25507/m.43540 type:complete len:115 (+) Transcript_25507:643-987(+)